LPTDIWNYSSRTLSSFGDLIANIWNFGNRTISNSSSNTTNNYVTNNNLDTSDLAKKSDINALKKEILHNQNLLEKAINKPIIKNYLEDEPDINLNSKLRETDFLLTKIFAETYFIDSQFSGIDLKWSKIEDKELEDLVVKRKKSINNLTNLTKKLTEFWTLETIKIFSKQLSLLNNKILVIESDFKVEGRSKVVKNDIYNFNLTLNNLLLVLGTNKDSKNKNTIYGKVNEIKFLTEKYDYYLNKVNKLLADYEKRELKEVQKEYELISKEFVGLNKLSRFIITSDYYNNNLNKRIKNQLLAFKGLVEGNKKLLTKNNERPFSTSWIEEGSMPLISIICMIIYYKKNFL